MLGTLAQFQTVLLIVHGTIGSLECVLEVQAVGGTLPFGMLNPLQVSKLFYRIEFIRFGVCWALFGA